MDIEIRSTNFACVRAARSHKPKWDKDSDGRECNGGCKWWRNSKDNDAEIGTYTREIRIKIKIDTRLIAKEKKNVFTFEMSKNFFFFSRENRKIKFDEFGEIANLHTMRDSTIVIYFVRTTFTHVMPLCSFFASLACVFITQLFAGCHTRRVHVFLAEMSGRVVLNIFWRNLVRAFWRYCTTKVKTSRRYT